MRIGLYHFWLVKTSWNEIEISIFFKEKFITKFCWKKLMTAWKKFFREKDSYYTKWASLFNLKNSNFGLFLILQL